MNSVWWNPNAVELVVLQRDDNDFFLASLFAFGGISPSYAYGHLHENIASFAIIFLPPLPFYKPFNHHAHSLYRPAANKPHKTNSSMIVFFYLHLLQTINLYDLLLFKHTYIIKNDLFYPILLRRRSIRRTSS